MQEILTLLLSFSVVFAIGYVVARTFLTLRGRPRKEEFIPVENAKVRMKTSGALYRCRLVSHGPKSWIMTAPMHRDNYVPVSVGETVTCEVIAQGGLLLFTSTVIARKSIEGTISIAAPTSVKLDNRRDKSDRELVDMAVVVSGTSGEVMDLSPGGARVKIKGFQREGNIVTIDLPTGESRAAVVVDSKNDHMGSVIRLKFDDPIAMETK